MFSKVKGYETNYDSLLSCVLRTSYELEIVLPVLQIKSNQNKTIVRDSWKKVLFGHHYLGLNNLTKQFIEICQYFVNIYQRCKKILQTGLFAFFIHSCSFMIAALIFGCKPYKNWVPSIQTHSLWLIFMWMKQKKI